MVLTRDCLKVEERNRDQSIEIIQLKHRVKNNRGINRTEHKECVGNAQNIYHMYLEFHKERRDGAKNIFSHKRE